MIDFINAISDCVNKKHNEETLRRAKICAGCDEKEKAFYASMVNAEIKEIQGFVCARCNCPLATKVFATEPKNICKKWLK